MCYPLKCVFLYVGFELIKGLLTYFLKLRNKESNETVKINYFRKRTKQTLKTNNLNELMNDEFKII